MRFFPRREKPGRRRRAPAERGATMGCAAIKDKQSKTGGRGGAFLGCPAFDLWPEARYILLLKLCHWPIIYMLLVGKSRKSEKSLFFACIQIKYMI